MKACSFYSNCEISNCQYAHRIEQLFEIKCNVRDCQYVYLEEKTMEYKNKLPELECMGSHPGETVENFGDRVIPYIESLKMVTFQIVLKNKKSVLTLVLNSTGETSTVFFDKLVENIRVFNTSNCGFNVERIIVKTEIKR